uniref:Uncharacterized protein n=1 Tax=Myotis myotis TaxID=51298 RepID=A0A7J7R7F8_MYOMY|nr:hypothetical protein mMyoMyo1_010880 [Myotis myotis]
MREKHRPAAPCTLPTGDVPATKAHALDRNRTRDPSVRRPTLYPLSQTGFGLFYFILFFFFILFYFWSSSTEDILPLIFKESRKEGGRGRDRERETSMGDTSTSCPLHRWGSNLKPRHVAPARNGTHDPWSCLMLQPLSYTSHILVCALTGDRTHGLGVGTML